MITLERDFYCGSFDFKMKIPCGMFCVSTDKVRLSLKRRVRWPEAVVQSSEAAMRPVDKIDSDNEIRLL